MIARPPCRCLRDSWPNPGPRGRPGRAWLRAALLAAPLAWASCVLPERTAAPLAVSALRCESEAGPLGVDRAQPVLGWTVRGEGRGRSQSAWQILVASDPAKLDSGQGDLWDSGKQPSAETAAIPYAGQALAPAERVYWKVRAWDEGDRASAWSEPASWTMGLLAPADWRAQWLTDARFLWWERPAIGYRSTDVADPAMGKWLEIDLGAPQPVDAVRLFPLEEQVAAGQGFPVRFRIELASRPDRSDAAVLADFTDQDYRILGNRMAEFQAYGRVGRYLRISATRLAMEAGRGFFGLSQVEVISRGRNLASGADVRASDSREDPPWSVRSVVDGFAGSVVNPYANATLRLRRSFTVRPGLRRALAFVCGLGDCQVTVNGRRPDEELLSPGWTDYAKTRLYATRDITGLLQPGPNAIGLSLAGGMFNVQAGRYVKFVTAFRPLQAIAQLRLEYADGSVETIGTGPDWKVRLGPTTFANVYGGEDYDARLEEAGWDRPDFNDQDWAGATPLASPTGALRGASFAGPPVRSIGELSPVSVHAARGFSVYDLGQNAAVMPILRVRGPAGAIVRITPAELLGADGSVSRASVGGGEAYWQYTLRGDPAGETWSPWSFYHGCRYLQVERRPAAGSLPVVESLVGRVVTAATTPAGDFACSNPLFDRIHTLVRWAQQNNAMSVLTDCPHRERLGWLEQTHLNGPALRYEFDLNTLFGKIARDLRDAQEADGFVPDIAPEYVRFAGGFRDSPEWGSASVLVPWQSYEWTGDADSLRQAYASMERYAAYLATRADARGLLDYGLGDWFDLGPRPPGRAQLTPVAVTATAYYYRDTRILEAAARILGREADARQWAARAAGVAAAFNRAFLDPASGRYATGSQCSEAIALVFGLAPPAERPRVEAALVADIRRQGNAFTAGDVGYEAVLRALAQAGRSDLIYALNDQAVRPGYGFQLARGATSLTEAWDAGPRASQDHFMLGQINEWLYRDLAGIAQAEGQAGFRQIVIKPTVVGDLRWVRAHYDSVHGRVSCQWTCEGSHLALDVEIPCNTTALVYVPNPSARPVTESGVPVQFASHVGSRGRSGQADVFAVGSGHYRFESGIAPP